jgi:deoxyadenosine/deoxycytidine kinase
MSLFVAIAGNIGVGKSSLTHILSHRLGWRPFFEAVDDNPYLADFYADMRRWSFHSQIFFLGRRLQDHLRILACADPAVQDRAIYEDAEIFARNLYRRGDLAERDYRIYRTLYQGLIQCLQPPDLIVYLRASTPTLQRRIRRRGREYELATPASYLGSLNDLYDEWAASFDLCPVLSIPTDGMDFVQCPGDAQAIVTQIQGCLP